MSLDNELDSMHYHYCEKCGSSYACDMNECVYLEEATHGFCANCDESEIEEITDMMDDRDVG